MSEPAFMEPQEEQQVVATLQLTDTKELLFYAHSFRNRRFGSIRIYIDTPKYSGPTKSGLDMTLSQLKELGKALSSLPEELESGRLVPPLEVARIPGEGKGSTWVVQIIEPEGARQQCLDVRKYVESEKFTGWTTKGLRIDVDLIDEVIERLPLLVHSLQDWEAGKTGMFASESPASQSEVARDKESKRDPDSLDSVPDDLKGYF